VKHATRAAFGEPPLGALHASIIPLSIPLHLVVGGLTTTTYWGYRGDVFGWSKTKARAKVAPETLQEQIDALEGKFRALMIEWTDTYDKLYRLAGRMDASKRWTGEKPAPVPTSEPGKAPENGSEEAFLAPTEPAPVVAAKSRKDLLAQWKT